MQFKIWLENIVNNPDGSVSIPNPDAITMDQWQKINNYLVRKGYDLRGAEDTKTRLGRWKSYDKDHAAAIRFALGQTPEGMPKPKRVMSGEQKVMRKATRELGVTENFLTAGFIMPNGRMIDLQARGSSGWGSGRRDLDHREINRFIEKPNPVDPHSATENLTYANTQLRIIRVATTTDPRTGMKNGYVHCYVEPTKAQYKKLIDLFDFCDGEKVVDCMRDENWGSLAHQEFDARKSTYAAIQFIKNYYAS
jgi:hypothetical protein